MDPNNNDNIGTPASGSPSATVPTIPTSGAPVAAAALSTSGPPSAAPVPPTIDHTTPTPGVPVAATAPPVAPAPPAARTTEDNLNMLSGFVLQGQMQQTELRETVIGLVTTLQTVAETQKKQDETQKQQGVVLSDLEDRVKALETTWQLFLQAMNP